MLCLGHTGVSSRAENQSILEETRLGRGKQAKGGKKWAPTEDGEEPREAWLLAGLGSVDWPRWERETELREKKAGLKVDSGPRGQELTGPGTDEPPLPAAALSRG